MGHYTFFVLLSVITAISSYLNFRYLKLPKSIGLIIVSALVSLLLFTSMNIEPQLFTPVYKMLNSLDFKEVVLKGMLGYLLFASAMHLSFVDLKKYLSNILTFASVGVLISTFIIGTICWLIAPIILNDYIPYSVCLLVGAIISPTDPVTVFAVFKKNQNVPEKVKSVLIGESLFNDVISIVLFVVLVSMIFSTGDYLTANKIIMLFLREGLGGIALGVLIGYIGIWFMHRADDGQTLIIISLALVSFGFWLAEQVTVSGPLVMVVTGLIIGNSNFRNKLSRRSKHTLNSFWFIIDELLNTFLFVLVGIEILEMKYTTGLIIAALIGFFVTIVARYVSVTLPMLFLERKVNKDFWKNSFAMTWGGLRGGVSIALALSIPFSEKHSITFSVIYITVLLSIFIQGITFKPILDKLYK
ncbi:MULTISPECIES: cation:proton antiporter [unclassified Francisella]|uniref:cation:proton antiporter n=1 Tax=unclassified Francisella TaxID=2610885 RepID=UPI002E2F3DA2|nr:MULTISPECIES: sodium:proton antiporter [unclassified Francisella]MED7819538.1 sodium:proton antiporter [Francisella sp. 19S2-4]MED7830348.1 sodium:proton antiporter [Francisella sp. 19S2-10]